MGKSGIEGRSVSTYLTIGKIKDMILDSKLEQKDYNRALEALMQILPISSGERRQDLTAYAELARYRIRDKLIEKYGERAILGRPTYPVEEHESSD